MTSVAALSEADICNMSLSHLGVSQGIQSIDPPDNSTQGAACAFWYPKMRNVALRSAPWNFAYVNSILTSDTTTMPGWGYAYQYPNDCLQAVAVTTYSGLRLANSFWSGYWAQGYMPNYSIPKVPFKVVQSTGVPGMQAIMCDLSTSAPAYLFYIQCVTNTALFDPMFTDYVSLLVASRIGGTLRADMKRVTACAQAAESMRLQALAQTMNESQQDQERVSPSISIR